MPARFLLISALVLCALSQIGCGGVKVQPENLRLTQSLHTAVAAKNTAWLAENKRVLEAKRNAGTLTEEEFGAFQAVLDQAERGDWSGAEAAIRALQKSQRPTPK